MNTKLRYLAVLVAASLALVFCLPTFGQVLKASISGTLVDPQGAVVTGAQVKAKNMETGAVFTTATDSSGNFRLNLLPVGTYSIEISAQGFKTAARNSIATSAGQDSALGTLKMSLGEKSTTVEVSGEAPLIETTQAQISNTFSGQALNTFAGIQENEGLDRLALFVPGIASSRSNNFSNTNGASISSNGLRGRNNDQEIDGQNNNDNSVGGPGLFVSDPEFVQQYVIVTNQFGPEYGRNSGSVINIITKQGGNSWHGSVFGTEGSSYLNALSNTQKNTLRTLPTGKTVPFSGPPRSNDEFTGGTIGGPIMKNKAFLFFGFDNEILSALSVSSTTSLTPTPTGLATLGGCGAAINSSALALLQKFGPYAFGFGNPTPRPTGPKDPSGNPTFVTQTIGTCAGVQVGGVTRTVAAPFHGYDFVVRNDVQLSRDSITSRYIYNRGSNFNISDNGAGGWYRNTPALSQAILESWTHNFTSHMVNEARVSFGRLGVEFGGGLNPFEPVANELANAFTNITFQAGGGLSIGPATNLPQSRLVNTWQGQDNWNYVMGKHQLKAGVNWSYQRSPNIFLPLINGSYRYPSLASFLTTFTANRVQVAQGNPSLDFREYDTFAYAGDDWKFGRSLTLNLGVTWTYYGSPANLFNQFTTKRESNPATALWLQSLPLSARTNPEIPAVTDSFGPSVGFAYQPQWGGFITGHGKTTLRGGYRLLYDPPFYNIFVNISSSAPMTFLQTITSGITPGMMPAVPIGPNVRSALASFITPNTFDPRAQNETNVSNNFGPDKVHSWTLGFEREVTKNSVVEARYVGNHGVNLFQTVDANPFVGTAAKPGQLQAGLLPASTPSCAATTQIGPGAGTDVGRLSCGVGVSRTRNNGSFSDYHGLQTEFRAQNLFKQLFIRTSYTWSKNLDNVSEIFATGTAGNTLFAAQNPFQTGGAERSTSGLDYTHIWSMVVSEQLPFFKQQRGIIGRILGGWTISANYLLASGQPYTPAQLTEALNGTTADVYDLGFINAFVGSDTARPFFGNRNAPDNTVAIFAADGCTFGNAGFFPGLAAGAPRAALCTFATTSPNVLVSVNQLNGGLIATAADIRPITNNDAKFIINSRIAQQTFGTPFGNVPRNPVRDAISNIANATVFKNFKLGERANFEIHLTGNNVFNHFNFGSVDVVMEDASVNLFGRDFANPSVTAAGGRTVFVGGKLTF